MPLLTGFAFGAGGLSKATYTATTGSPTIDTTSRPGKTIIKYTGSGSITVATAGMVELLIVSGGGGGAGGGNPTYSGGSGGSGGGVTYSVNQYLPAGTFTVAIGAG